MKVVTKIFENIIKLMNKDILITKEMLLVWNVKIVGISLFQLYKRGSMNKQN